MNEKLSSSGWTSSSLTSSTSRAILSAMSMKRWEGTMYLFTGYEDGSQDAYFVPKTGSSSSSLGKSWSAWANGPSPRRPMFTATRSDVTVWVVNVQANATSSTVSPP